MARITPERITKLKPNEIFVFGSNKQGHHGGGAAAYAYGKFGAEWGNGYGLQGQTYAIPTLTFEKGLADAKLPLTEIYRYVYEFIAFAKQHPEYTFLVTPIGCGIAGFTAEQIAPMFRKALKLKNVYLPQSFIDVIGQGLLRKIVNESIEKVMSEIDKNVDTPEWVYCGVFLRDTSSNVLKNAIKNVFNLNLPDDWRIYCHHMTLAFNNGSEESQQIFDYYKNLFGKEVTLQAAEIGYSDKAIAIKILKPLDIPCANAIKHITIAVSPNGKPVDSNKISNWETLPNTISVRGRFGYFGKDKTVHYGN